LAGAPGALPGEFFAPSTQCSSVGGLRREDRLSDSDSALLPELGLLDTYRPQESLTCQLVEAMVQAVRGRTAPVSDRVSQALAQA
jgi:hypothetical protein